MIPPSLSVTRDEDRLHPWAPAVGTILFLLVYFFPFYTSTGALAKIGNDFEGLYANYATYNAEAIASGILPWWNPNEGAGFPFHSNPFAAFFYPGNLFALAVVKAFGQYTWYHHQIFMVIGVIWFALGLCAWLRLRGSSGSAAFVAAVTIAIGYRVADIYRFPNAVHAVAWLPWMLVGFERWLDGRLASGLLLGVFASVSMNTAGYPYYAVYGYLFFCGYLILRGIETGSYGRLLVRASAILLPAFLLTAPYLLGVRRLLASTVDRSGTSYAFSTEHSWSYTDLVGGLVFPPSASSEGWLYFGILPLLLIGLWLWTVRPRTPEVGWAALTLLAVQMLAMSGESFIFPLVWAHAPLLGSLRVWPRSSIVLLVPLALLLARAYDSWRSEGLINRGSGARILALGAGVLALQLILWGTQSFDFYHVKWFSFMEPSAFVVQAVVAVLALLALTFVADLPRLAVTRPGVLGIVVLTLIASDVGQYGRSVWRAGVGVRPPAPHPTLTNYFPRYLHEPRTDGVGMVVPYRPTMGVMANWFYDRYVAFVKTYGRYPSFESFMGREGRKLFFVDDLDAPPDEFEAWWSRLQEVERTARAGVTGGVRFDGSTLSFGYSSASAGYILWVDNWDPDWRAELNGVPVEILRPFGTFKAVHVEPGLNLVTFRYRPMFPGWWLAPVGLLLLVLEAVTVIRRRRLVPPSIVSGRDRHGVRAEAW